MKREIEDEVGHDILLPAQAQRRARAVRPQTCGYRCRVAEPRGSTGACGRSWPDLGFRRGWGELPCLECSRRRHAFCSLAQTGSRTVSSGQEARLNRASRGNVTAQKNTPRLWRLQRSFVFHTVFAVRAELAARIDLSFIAYPRGVYKARILYEADRLLRFPCPKMTGHAPISWRR